MYLYMQIQMKVKRDFNVKMVGKWQRKAETVLKKGIGYDIMYTRYNDVRVKRYFAPNLISTNCSAAKQLSQFSNIRNPLIYCVNRYFLMFGGSQVQKSYRASTNDFLTF